MQTKPTENEQEDKTMTKMLSKIGGLFTPHHVKTRFSKQRCRDASKYLPQRKPHVLIWGAGLILSLFLFAIPYATAGTVSYTYDDAGRLIRADFGDGKVIEYTYDNAGSLLERRIGSGTNIFSDVSSSNWAYNYINNIYNAGVTRGCAQDDPNTPGNERMYCPDSTVTRGQMAAFIIRSKYGENFTYTTTPYFSDVPSTHTFFKYVQKLRDVGITAVSGTYSVDSYVTRGQMAAFLIRAKYGENFTYTTTPYYSDVPSTHNFFKYVQKLRDDEITTTTGTYNVDNNVTRDQMAAFLARTFLGIE